MLPSEEYIEQAYFFRTMRERLADGMPAQEVLAQCHEEILSTTRLPMAIQFLAGEIKLNGVMAPAMQRLTHYFTPWQTFVIARAEDARARFDVSTGLEILQREAEYKAKDPTPAGLFVYQFESMSRNRLGYDEGLRCAAGDPLYDEAWQKWIKRLRGTVGHVDFGDLVFLSSQYHQQQRRRLGAAEGDENGKFPILFGEKEGKIAWANRGKDPLYLFAALQRQLGYPVVPRPARGEQVNRLPTLERKIHQLEMRIKLLESELKGTLDLSKFYAKPEAPEGGRKASKQPGAEGGDGNSPRP
jgi:hypothetical protein